jgi:excisionase family DNA binding protein
MGSTTKRAAVVPPESDRPIWVRPKEAARLGGFGLTRCYELIDSGKLKSIKVGGMRLVSVASIESLGE